MIGAPKWNFARPTLQKIASMKFGFIIITTYARFRRPGMKMILSKHQVGNEIRSREKAKNVFSIEQIKERKQLKKSARLN